jgi:hypothetical protein
MNKRVTLPVLVCPEGRDEESELVRNGYEGVAGGVLTREQALYVDWLPIRWGV